MVSAKIRVGNEPYNYTPVTRFCFAKKKVFKLANIKEESKCGISIGYYIVWKKPNYDVFACR